VYHRVDKPIPEVTAEAVSHVIKFEDEYWPTDGVTEENIKQGGK
jgi:hypothetical protein